jgi:hypothetical protein
MTDVKKPKIAQSETDKLQGQFDNFNDQVQSMTLDRMNQAPKIEQEQQTKLSSQQLAATKSHYLKPTRSINSKEKFNENYRQQYEEAREYVEFIAENREIIGEDIELWTKPFAGMPAEFWKVPVNKPVWGPKYLRDQLQRCYYHRMSMQNTSTGIDGMGQYYGTMVVDNIVNRIDAYTPNAKRQFSFAGIGK